MVGILGSRLRCCSSHFLSSYLHTHSALQSGTFFGPAEDGEMLCTMPLHMFSILCP